MYTFSSALFNRRQLSSKAAVSQNIVVFIRRSYCCSEHTYTYMYIRLTALFPGLLTTRVSRYQKGKTNLDSTEERDSEWQWHQLGHMQVCISLQTDNHASIPPFSFLQAGCPSAA